MSKDRAARDAVANGVGGTKLAIYWHQSTACSPSFNTSDLGEESG
jgi:hypothetical protein